MPKGCFLDWKLILVGRVVHFGFWNYPGIQDTHEIASLKPQGHLWSILKINFPKYYAIALNTESW